MQGCRDQGDGDRAGLADTHFARQFRYIEHRDIQKIAISDGVFMRG